MRYDLALDLRDRRVLVVGAGRVASRRIDDLLAVGARVEVVAPTATESVQALAETGRLVWHRRVFATADVTEPAPAWLVHTATGTVDAEVAAVAEAARVWCVRADSAAASSAHRPAVASGAAGTPSEGLRVAVSAGGDPRRATALRDAIDAALAAGTLPVRRQRGSGPGGRVWLVGAGPGDPDLISVRGRALLATADVVLADRLGTEGLLGLLGEGVEVIDVGKRPGRHGTIQDRINALLVEHARAGRRVVRLKGGDPFVLGRGGEELAHCVAHGVEVEVVPGITSAISVPAAAGVPVTHRGVSTSFVVASGHGGAESIGHLLQLRDTTLVLLMAVGQLAAIVDALLAAGHAADTPVAIVENGWTSQQRTTRSTLAAVVELAGAVGVANPAVVVVGAVAGLDLQPDRTPAVDLDLSL